MATGDKRTTIIDVGRQAGVSAKTVSRVLNSEPHVSKAVAARVHAAARALNYHPNAFAQALVRRRSHLVGLVYENPSPSYVVELQRGVIEQMQGSAYQLVVIPVAGVIHQPGGVVRLLRSAALDGVVLSPPACDDLAMLADLDAAGIRYARIAPSRGLDIGAVNLMNDIAAAREIAAHVLALGHRDIAVITGDPSHSSSDARLLGYRQAFDAAGIGLRPERIATGSYTRESGHAAAERLLDGDSRPTAILAHNDDMAVGALLAARERGLTIPGDLTIVGFDDSEVAQVTWPRITTIHQPVFEMAKAASRMVIDQLEGRDFPARQDHRHALVVRESSGPPPRRP